MCVNLACTRSSACVLQAEGPIHGSALPPHSKHSTEASTFVWAPQQQFPLCDEEPSASLPGALALTLPRSSLSGGLGRTGAGPRLAVLQPSGGRTPVTAQLANSHYNGYEEPRGRCMRAAQRPHYFRSKVCVAQKPASSNGQQQMFKGGGQAWLKLPAVCLLGTWPRLWAQPQWGCGAPELPWILAVLSRCHIIWFLYSIRNFNKK